MEKCFADKNVQMGTLLILGLMILTTAGTAAAGADSTFLTAQTTLYNWIGGSLGRMVALASLGIGVVSAIVTRSLMPVAISTGVGITASVGPTILTGMVAATL